MKVCMITGTLPPMKCGVGDYTSILCNNLSELHKDLDISVITTRNLNLKKNNKYSVHDVIENWNLKGLYKVLKEVDKVHPDIVHIQYPTSQYYKKIIINLLPFLLKKKYKVITTLHEYSDINKIRKILTLPYILFSDAVIVVDDNYIKDIKKLSIINENKLYYINIASNIPKSKMNKLERESLRKSILKNNCNTVIGYFGFIHEGKGIESIIYSMNLLKKQNKLNTIFLIIGELDPNNNYHKSILCLIEKFRLKEYIHITGYLDKNKVGNYISTTDIMILPFVNGLSPKNGSFLASIQEGKSVVTTMRNGKKVFDDLNVIYLERYDDIKTLKNIIELNQQKGIENYKINSNVKFSWKSIVYRYWQIYRNIIKK